MSRRMWAILVVTTICLALPMGVLASSVSFSTFVQQSAIAGAEGGNNSTIAFTYAGTMFVGSVYFGPDNNQLYSTNLSGGNVTQFGSPIPNASGEVVVGAGLGQGGFTAGAVYAGSQANGQIWSVPSSGSPTMLVDLNNLANPSINCGCGVRGILFDPGSSFGGDMLVTTNAGKIYKVTSGGAVSLVASVGEDTEGMDIATSAWGSYKGDLLVASEGSGNLRLISPTGSVTVIGSVSSAETVSFVPLNLGASGNPIEGFYVANYPHDVQFAGASQFSGLQGDAVITSEDCCSPSRVWDLHFDSGSGGFSLSQFSGGLPNQSEDGIFVTAQRIQEINGTPEPASFFLFGSGLAALTGVVRRHRKS